MLPRFPSLGRRQAGKTSGINGFSIGMLLLAAGAAYWVYVWVPVYMRNQRVYSAMKEAAFQGWQMKDDNKLREMVHKKVTRLYPPEKNTDGRYPQFELGDISIERDDERIYIDLAYAVNVHYPWIDKTTEKVFTQQAQATLAPPTSEKDKNELMKWLTE